LKGFQQALIEMQMVETEQTKATPKAKATPASRNRKKSGTLASSAATAAGASRPRRKLIFKVIGELTKATPKSKTKPSPTAKATPVSRKRRLSGTCVIATAASTAGASRPAKRQKSETPASATAASARPAKAMTTRTLGSKKMAETEETKAAKAVNHTYARDESEAATSRTIVEGTNKEVERNTKMVRVGFYSHKIVFCQ
jgi:hypothetical protein